jgi:glycosyltransferase involved in cell wall biosynthesis
MTLPERVPFERPEAAPLRVLMLGPALEVRGGISAVERALIAALPPRVCVRHLPTMREGSKAAKLAAFLRSARATWQETRRETRPDIVHIHFASRASSVRKMALARLALARGCAVVMHAHGGGYREYWQAAPSFQKRHIVETLNRASALIVLGETWREFFAGIGVPGERIVVMPNPVVLPTALPVRIGAARVTFVYLGLVSAAKGAFDLVAAVSRLAPQTRSRLRLVIAGNGELDALRRKIAQSGLEETIGVRPWLGVAERDALLSSAEAFVLPSRHEGLPMALLEAMAWGLAPVSTPVGAIPEIVAHEQNGLLVPPGDVAALAGAMERLLEPRLRAQLGRAARRRVEPLAVDRYAERLIQLYEAIACSR